MNIRSFSKQLIVASALIILSWAATLAVILPFEPLMAAPKMHITIFFVVWFLFAFFIEGFLDLTIPCRRNMERTLLQETIINSTTLPFLLMAPFWLMLTWDMTKDSHFTLESAWFISWFLAVLITMGLTLYFGRRWRTLRRFHEWYQGSNDFEDLRQLHIGILLLRK